MARDIEIAALREQGVSFRGVAARLGMSLGSVQLAVKRLAQAKPPDPGPNLLEMYRAMRGLSRPEQQAALGEFRVAADEYRRSVRNSPDLEDRGYL